MGRELIDKEDAIIAIRTCFADSPALASVATSAIYSLPVKKSVSVYSEGYSYRDLGDSCTNSVKRQLLHYLIDDIVAAGGVEFFTEPCVEKMDRICTKLEFILPGKEAVHICED